MLMVLLTLNICIGYAYPSQHDMLRMFALCVCVCVFVIFVYTYEMRFDDARCFHVVFLKQNGRAQISRRKVLWQRVLGIITLAHNNFDLLFQIYAYRIL